MNKFLVAEYPATDETKPVLYKVFFANNYYLHKGKKLRESVDRFLDDVWRGMRGKSFPAQYSEVILHCNAHPSLYKVTIDVVLNDTPARILKKEEELYETFKKDKLDLHVPDMPPYKPEWMLKEMYQKRCDPCIKSAIVDGKKMKFRFCPRCGHAIN